MTDNEFDLRMTQILNKEKIGLREIYNAYGRVIYQQMLSVVKSPQDAEDLTSDFFLKLWDTADKYRSGTGHKRYISVMARNMALDFLRKRSHEAYSMDDTEHYHEEQSDGGQTDQRIIGNITYEQALALLNDEERQIVDLRLGMELTFLEISKVMGRPLGTVTWKYRQALQKLKKTVKEGSIDG